MDTWGVQCRLRHAHASDIESIHFSPFDTKGNNSTTNQRKLLSSGWYKENLEKSLKLIFSSKGQIC